MDYTPVFRQWVYYQKKIVYLFILYLLISSLVESSDPEVVCGSIDIRNSVDKFHKLENCTVIEGHLVIVLLDYAKWHEFQKVSFPKLREITDYLLVYRVYGLKTFSSIFPNLTVIRGQSLFYNYALVFFEVPVIEDIGLIGLTVIERGAVRLEKNMALCHIDTIDWQLITNVKDEDHFILQNKATDDCINMCPKYSHSKRKVSSDGVEYKQPLCWSYNHSQIVCPARCGRSGCYNTKGSRGETVSHCCADSCLGGCYGPNDTQCMVCKKVRYNGRCQPRCPIGTYEFHKRRCITDEECKDMKHQFRKIQYKVLNTSEGGKCEMECPSGYIENEAKKWMCQKCEGSCPKICEPLTIHSVSAAQSLRGCTVIDGILEIEIRGGSQVEVELERNLGNIEEIRNHIIIRQSNALTSLNFLKSLRLISGSFLMSKRYALFVLDNHNLQDIWDRTTHPKLKIEKGKVFFHFNPKLCLNKIDEFVKDVGLENVTESTDISRQTNGDQAACNITTLALEFTKVHNTFAIIRWENFVPADHRELLSWVVNYREAEEKNVTIFNARDACGTDVWTTVDVDPEVSNTAEFIAAVLFNLEPYTQYAVYVQTYTISTATRGAVTGIGYFKTLPDVPSQARDIKVESLKPGELYLTWKPPNKPNGNVTHYIIYYQPIYVDPMKFEIRNYCENRLQNYNKSVTPEQENKNKNVSDGDCCACPETTEQQRIDEDERQFQIVFENYLQNQVYRIKEDPRSFASSSKRRKREAQPRQITTPSPKIITLSNPDHPHLLHPNNTHNRTDFPPNPNNTESWYAVDEDEDDYGYASVNMSTEIVLTNLDHFQEYSIEIIACHEYEERLKNKLCSNRAITAARTKPSVNADIIDHRNITTENISRINNSSEIQIRWPEPPHPNGLILAYDIELRRVGIKNLKPDKFCIPHKHYRRRGGYSLSNLPSGNWSYKIRATSLAGYGPWTPDLYFYVVHVEVLESFPVELVAGVVIVGVGIIVVVAVALVCYVNRKRGIPSHNGLYASINPDYLGAKEVYVPDEWEVDRDKVELLKELGKGSFGMVYEGIAKGVDEKQPRLKVAVKTVNEDASLKDRIEFLHEASIMKAFTCTHVVRLLGVVSIGQPTLVIMELMSNGDLKSFLRLHRPDYEGRDGRKPPTLKEVLQMAGEIADGMAYLTKEKFVHRDLAARNCMVSDNKIVKIGDFGMTRDIYETDYYRKGGKGLLPVRWMAPESLRDGVFSSQSDVWSYGVVLWEMATLAAQPYPARANEQVLKFVVDGNIMEMPENCPERLYQMMVNCWKYTPRQRPTFLEIIEELVPELDPSFRDNSFFFSDLNQAPEEEEEEEIKGQTEAEEDGVITPLTSSPQRMANTLTQPPRAGGDSCSNSDYEEEDTTDLKSSSRSSLSYKSHSQTPPPSSQYLQQDSGICPHNHHYEGGRGTCNKCNSSSSSGRISSKGDGGNSGIGDDKKTVVTKPYNVIQTNNSKNSDAPSSTTGSSTSSSKKPPPLFSNYGSAQEKWSPDSNHSPAAPPPPPTTPGVVPTSSSHSDEGGSKGSSKSSNSNGLNGLANGHIPRLILPEPTC